MEDRIAAHPERYGRYGQMHVCSFCGRRDLDHPKPGCEGCGYDHCGDAHEQARRWAALDASVPCSHTIPGTCDYC
jgi:hypothetical protein